MSIVHIVISIILFLAGFTAVHVFKALRLYLVLMEQQISFGRFLYIYLETTCVNLIIPFKLGEIYRVCRLSMETGKLALGILSVATDRFFDTASLLVLLFLMKFLGVGEFNLVMGLLLVVILAMAFVYAVFPSTFRYLNRYIIMNKDSSRSMAVLSALEVCNEWYEYLTRLIRGRSALMIAFSLLGWAFEGITLTALAGLIGVDFGFGEYGAYISSIFTSDGNSLLAIYSFIGIAILGVLVVVGLPIQLMRRRKDTVDCNEKN